MLWLAASTPVEMSATVAPWVGQPAMPTPAGLGFTQATVSLPAASETTLRRNRHAFDRIAFRPRVLVVAFYSGNDAFDAVKVAYNLDAWKSLRALPQKPADPPSD